MCESLGTEENVAYLVKGPEDVAAGLDQVWHQVGHQQNEGFQADLLLVHQVDSRGDFRQRDPRVAHHVMDLQGDLRLDSQEELLELWADQEVRH